MNSKSFCIEFIPGEISTFSNGEKAKNARISIGSFNEVFSVPLSYWTEKEYEQQWIAGLDRIVLESTSCFVTGMRDPENANFIFIWSMYREGEMVYFQNNILFLDELGEPFDESNIYRYIPSRETINDEGEKISEWSLQLTEML